MSKVKIAALALVFGILGVVVALAGVHLYQDHQMLHALINIEAQRQQAAQKQAGPMQAPEAK
jgi:hypothetical protein